MAPAPPALTAAINPSATDAAYDGIDTDCDGLNDWDWDRDGYVRIGDDDRAGGTAGMPERHGLAVGHVALGQHEIDRHSGKRSDHQADVGRTSTTGLTRLVGNVRFETGHAASVARRAAIVTPWGDSKE